jgi:DNA-binding PucR family transcriptional regulator
VSVSGSAEGRPRSEVERLTSLPRRVLEEVAREAGRDAQLDSSMVTGYLEALLRAARVARSLEGDELDEFRLAGQEAAERNVALSRLLDLYLSATWRLWREFQLRAPKVSAEVLAEVADSLFRSSDDTAQAIGHGFQQAQRLAIRREEALRREFMDELLAGRSDPELLDERSEGFGFNLLGGHRVVVARADRPLEEANHMHARMESRVLALFGDRDALVATREGLLVCVFPDSVSDPAVEVARLLREMGEGTWRIGVGRVEAGLAGVSRSYRQATDALDITARLGMQAPVASFESLLPYHLISRDRPALAEAVGHVLGGLERARGGAGPLVETLEAYFAESGNVTATARRLHLSPRAVTYRLQTISKLTGRRPQDPEDRFLLELAVRGARLIAD